MDDQKLTIDGNQTPAEERADERWAALTNRAQPQAKAELNIQVARVGKTDNRFIVSGPDAATMHQTLSDNYAEPGALRGNQFVFSAQAHHEANPSVMKVIDALNKRASSQGREIQ